MPLIDYPPVKQRDDFSCGRKLYEAVTGLLDRRRSIKSDPWDGTHPVVLEAAFRNKAKLQTFSGSMGLEHVRLLTGLGTPVCCLIKSEGEGHWVAVRGVLRNRVHFFDPAEGNRSLPAPEWEAVWYDEDSKGQSFRQFGLAVWC